MSVAVSPAVDGPRAETLQLLGELIAFDTVSSRSNRALIERVAARLRSLGIAAQVLPNESGDKASLWATIGPERHGGLVLSGHSDVVPVDGQRWSSEPFVMTRRGARLYGRGVADMKGFIACAVAALERHREAPLHRPVHLALTYDEEIGCLGAPKLLDWLAAQSLQPALALIGEPTDMRVVNSHKGILVVRTEISGIEAHSSLAHLGVSAIGLAGQAIVLLQQLQDELAATVRDPRFTPEHATISVNRIHGGTAVNILAGHVVFDWDLRSVPGVIGAEMLERFKARLEAEVLAPVRRQHPDVAVRTTVLADVPPLAPEDDGAAETLALRLLGGGAPLAVAFGAEAGQFQQAGMSTVIVGPGSIEQAHKADEYVELEQLARCDAFLDRLIAALAS